MMKETDNVETSFYHYDNLESIALDVVSSRNRIELSEFLEAALNSFSFYAKAYNACESLAAYILASMTCNREIDQLLFDTLDSLNRAPTNWGGTETLNQCVMVRFSFNCRQYNYFTCQVLIPYFVCFRFRYLKWLFQYETISSANGLNL